MAWDFETDPEFQKKLDWIEDFMREEVEPLSHLGMAVHGPLGREKFIKPLQEKVKAQKLWACHLGPELGGQGYGQVKLGLMNEKLGRNGMAPTVFGCQAPDSATPRSSPTTAPRLRRKSTSGRS
jgi:acyl-CoA dehydrogenase